MKKIFMFINVDWFFLSHRLPIAQAAKNNNIDMTVYTEFTKPYGKMKTNGYNFLKSPLKRSSKSILHFIFECFKSYKIIKKEKPNLIHAVTIKPILVLGIIARLTSTPFVGSISGLGPAFNPDNSIKKVRLWIILKILKFIFSRNDVCIICQNNHDQNVLLNYRLSSIDKILSIPGSGVDLENYSPSKKRSGNEKYVLMSSRILFDKGIKEYCMAAMKVRKKFGEEIKFKLSGPLDKFSPTSISEYEINKLVKKYGVEYLGNRNDMPELLASAQIFVLPSYYSEGLPKVLLEAAASGVPIITTDHPGCRDAVIDSITGILVATKDSDSLADEIIKLFRDKSLLINMGKNGRLLAEKSFKVSLVVDKHYSLYHKLV